MVWWCMGWNGVGQLAEIEGKMYADQFVSILEDHPLPSLEESGILLIPKSGLMPRSPSVPRSQPLSSYPLYSSLVFHCSQAPISITAKRLTQPRFPSFLCLAKKLTIPASQVPFLRRVTRQPCSIFWPSVILMTGSQVYWKGHSPSTVPI